MKIIVSFFFLQFLCLTVWAEDSGVRWLDCNVSITKIADDTQTPRLGRVGYSVRYLKDSRTGWDSAAISSDLAYYRPDICELTTLEIHCSEVGPKLLKTVILNRASGEVFEYYHPTVKHGDPMGQVRRGYCTVSDKPKF